MGRATRWLRGLFGMKKEKENVDNSNSGDRREKKRWSSGKSGGVGKIPGNIPAKDSDWLRSYVTENEQSKHAIAVATATAAAADAAVAAAQAAVAVVRLTSQGRGTQFCGGKREARKALRALKGLVKIQALVRGYLVRKRAMATLHSMQALIRAQATIRSQRARRSINKENNRFQPEFLARRSVERFDETWSEFQSKRLSASIENSLNSFEESPKIVEIDTYKPRIAGTSQILNGTSWAMSVGFPPPKIHPGLQIPAGHMLQATPAKSVCGDSFFRPYSNFPNYMANTQSFRAKIEVPKRSEAKVRARVQEEAFPQRNNGVKD
ncbi:hypothetical protein Acr_23g0001480 [Actinidia rufa]|uniref:DUF4005 domain-containing protein n=1 Tax=Actinidia rufa TaxID=165716 RepID=A0A7J0GLT3_9ERIC|nr:hypothetical protein Acr_23g0001480 [Actinidia rufa]